MIPALIVPILNGPELLTRFLASIDHPVEHLIVIDNGGVVVEADAMAERVSVIRLPYNLGVAGSWNLGIKCAPFAPWWLICNFDIVLPPRLLATIAGRLDLRESLVTYAPGANGFSCFSLGEQVVRDVGLFDEGFHPAYSEDLDYWRRCEARGRPVVLAPVAMRHDNSSTLHAGDFPHARTSMLNANYLQGKAPGCEGGWSLDRRRDQSWD